MQIIWPLGHPNPLQTFNDFSNASTGAGLDAFNNQAKSFVDQELNKAKTERTAKIANAISNIPGKLKTLIPMASIYLDEVKGRIY